MHLLVAILMQRTVEGDLDFLFLLNIKKEINVYTNELSQLTEEKVHRKQKITIKLLLRMFCAASLQVQFSSLAGSINIFPVAILFLA